MHAPAVIRFVQRRTGSSAAADDVTATVFEKAWRGLSNFDGGDDRFRPWVMKIAANEMASTFRSETRRSRREEQTARAEFVMRPTDDPQEAGIDLGAHSARRLRDAIGRLNPTHQEIIMFRFFADMSPSDVASALDVASGTASVRLHRALRALRDELERSVESREHRV
jgi:RNA polymerase sigma-70 factor (ECF subfamily)